MKGRAAAHLLGSGAILNEVLKAQEILADKYDVSADVWSVTSYKELYQDAVETERWNLLNPQEKPRKAYLEELLGGYPGVYIAASDYMKVLPAAVAQWIPGPVHCLGTDGFGRSESRDRLRDFLKLTLAMSLSRLSIAWSRQERLPKRRQPGRSKH